MKKWCLICIVSYIILSVLFKYSAGDQLKYREEKGICPTSQVAVGEIVKGITIEQGFVAQYDVINSISLITATYDRENIGNLIIKLMDQETRGVLVEKEINVKDVLNNTQMDIVFENRVENVKGKSLILEVSTDTGEVGNAVTIWSNTDNKDIYFNYGDQKLNGQICYSINGITYFLFGQYYWCFTLLGLVVLLIFSTNIIIKDKNKRSSFTLNLIMTFKKYKFLIDQLVARDFKTKYKRSVLGVLWSFLNPLLTMLVQYVIFSTLFKSDVENFPVYLLTGIVFFNFFTEAISMSIVSIVGNSSLITKVYVPKYIYTVCKVLSSSVNLLISLIPLIIVVLITRTPITKSILLFPFGVLCLIIFSIGLGLIFASLMVFFRDTQFLWGVVSMLWMYATPIFYPETIVPVKYLIIYKMNPLYHLIRFIRLVIIQGVSPEPKAYLICIIFALGTLLLGSFVFKKTQNKFVLYM